MLTCRWGLIFCVQLGLLIWLLTRYFFDSGFEAVAEVQPVIAAADIPAAVVARKFLRFCLFILSFL